MASMKRISPWIACLAILLNMLAMPMSRAMQTPDTHLLLWGGFCSGSGSTALPPGFKKLIDTLQPASSKAAMQHGDCCCGHAGLAALPSDYYRHFLPRYTPDTALANPEQPTLHPRVRWPSLTPRASPLA
ncbi:DUF2946 domain-containing protein [Pseudomonas lijiangensis]|uniref:DUF2946 domain-containing protein n=1 Tax=Pseudomonas lijiangensis TaxID=2995658 RepID=A0ABX8I337_9PSED|nr:MULTISPECIES: DUF2946 domain-containing protein [Pseudomonas syringae group]MBX8488737.1 DUF2946 domain-containing protein [Pseudomonas cichorii]MBX8498684.1 DUF2946 domain-containing protein [Pseudomonas lijiangensis]MBX8507776.1 DUF2946 domain-containing protein [Pseudomonas lijiangensis]MBX8556793.1 DUF2946 domain-containing protein [Pseudomonas cichorii]QWU85451.1 DUF2946 domain-containing protein [Pseudomonas lijiangensis]